MAKDPAVLFYTSDFLSGTITMPDESVGRYIKLLCIQHQKGRLTEKDMLSICRAYDEDVFSKFKKDAKGMYYNERMETEAKKRKAYTKSRSENAKSPKNKGDKPTKKDKSTSKAYAKHMENENEDENISEYESVDEVEILEYPSFEDFWELYDKKVDKVATEKKWGKLTQEEKEQAIEYIPQYKLSEPDKTFRKNPLTFINNKSWNNEIITKSRSGNDAKIPLASSFTPEDFGM